MGPSGLLLRFTSDLQLIVSEEKKLMPFCEYLRFLATEKGIGALTIEDHKMEPRMHEAHFSLFVYRCWFETKEAVKMEQNKARQLIDMSI